MAQNAPSGRTAVRVRSGETLVGRQRETAELLAALDGALAGHGSVALLAGEPGIGKTSLARALTEEAETRGALTVWGVAWAGGAAPAYWPWVQVVRTLARSLGRERLVSALGLEAHWLAELVPELRAELPAVRDWPSLASDEGRFRIYDAVAGLLRTAAEDSPLVIVIDDLHWADEASLHTLAFVARSLQDSGILLLGTYRDTEPESGANGTSVLAELLGWSRRIPLRGLGTADIRRLVLSLTSADAPDSFVEQLCEVTGGNPLFVSELVTLLDAEGRLGGELPRAGLPLPDGVREAIAQRMAPLPSEAVEALTAGAVIGGRFSVATLARTTGMERETLLELLGRAVAFGLVHPLPGEGDRYVFNHALVQATLYERLPPGRRVALHLAVGEAIEARAGDRIDSRLTELAHHFLEAAPLAGPERGVAFARRAGERAMKQFAYDEAASLYTRALAALEAAGGHEALPLLQALGEAQTRDGDTEAARRTLMEAADVARRQGDAHALARATLPLVTWGLTFGIDEDVVRMAEETVEALDGDTSGGLLARVEGLLAAALYWSPQTARREALCEHAVGLAREQHEREGDRASAETLAYVLGRALIARWGPESAERDLPHSQELKDLCHEIGDLEIELLASNWRISVLLETGDVGAVDEEIARVEHMATILRQPRAMVFLPLHRANRAVLDGRFDQAERCIGESAEIGRRVRGSVSELAASALLVILRLLEGRLPELESQLGALSSAHPELLALRCAYVELLVQAGRPAEARREFERVTAQGLDALPRDNTHIVMLVLLAEAAAELGDAERAAALRDRLEPFAGRWAVSPGAATLWPVARSLARLEGVLGREEEALAHLAEARSQAERAGARPSLALCALDEARILAAGDSPERERAAQLAAEAHALGAELGMRRVEEESERLLDRLASDEQAAPEEAARPAGAPGAGSLRREGDVWTVALGERVVRVKDAKGVHHLARLLANPGVEFHALELIAAEEGAPAAGVAPGVESAAAAELDVRRGGQSELGALLDPEAKAAYRQRLEELREAIEEAEALHDPERAELARSEFEAIAGELTGAVGLGGRDRPVGSDAERARVNVTRAIRSSLRRIEQHDARLGGMLGRSVRTGTFCAYEPDPEHPVSWAVEA